VTAPIISATKQVAARPVSRGMNMAIAPASSSEPMMYIPVLPRPMAWNPATFWASAVSSAERREGVDHRDHDLQRPQGDVRGPRAGAAGCRGRRVVAVANVVIGSLPR
jgi:hypothetical protein